MTDETTVPPRPDGFETFADAKKRRTQKIQILRQGNKTQQRLPTNWRGAGRDAVASPERAASACVCTACTYSAGARQFFPLVWIGPA
jgi:hypothetical protein